MKINIKTEKMELTPSLRTYIDEKLGGLSRFIKRFDETGDAQLWLEIGRTTQHHRKGDVFTAIADLRLPKQILRAEEEAEELHAAIDILEDKLKMEIEKYRTRYFQKPQSLKR